MAVYQYVKQAQRSPNTYHAMRQVKDICNPVSLNELLGVAEIWADAALRLEERDIRMMQRLVKRQNARIARQVQSD